MTIFAAFEAEFQAIIDRLATAGSIAENLDTSRVVFELPRDASHGDLATNAAMVLARQAEKPPRDLAKLFAAELERIAGVDAVEIAGPGFINLRIRPNLWADEIGTILDAGTDYGKSALGADAPVNIEFVSANPTGPLHAAHARGAVIGDYWPD